MTLTLVAKYEVTCNSCGKQLKDSPLWPNELKSELKEQNWLFNSPGNICLCQDCGETMIPFDLVNYLDSGEDDK